MTHSLQVRIALSFLVFSALILGHGHTVIGQETAQQQENQQAPSVVDPDEPQEKDESKSAADDASAVQEDEPEKSEAKTDEPEDDKLAGREDLDEAFRLKIGVTSLRDLDKVADKCESAIEKGLSSDSEEQAKELWASALISHARQLNRQIRPNGVLDSRWRVYRSQAISRLNKAIELRPGQIDGLILLARLHVMDSGDRDVALESIEKAIAQISDNNAKLSEALFIRASLAVDEKSQIADLTQAVKIDPQNADALMARASYFLGKENSKEALGDFKKLLAIEKGNLDRHKAIARLMRERRMFKESAEVLSWAVEAEEENEELRILRGQAYFSAEEDDKALEDFNKALEINRQNTDALSFRARVFLFQEKYEEALTDANELMQQEPDSPEGLALRSMIHRTQDKLDEAIKDTEGLLEMDEGNLDYMFDLALLHNANEAPSIAIPLFDRIIDSIAEDAAKTQILRSRADAYLSIGQHQKAIDDYELAIELLEDNSGSRIDGMDEEREKGMKAGLLNNLAWVLSTSPDEEVRDGKRSIELATEASELTDYKAAFILSTLASGYAEEGDFETARKWATKAVELAESEEQREGLKEELEFYKQDKAWRELEQVEKDKKEREKKEKESGDDEDEEGDDKDDGHDEKDEDKKGHDKDDDDKDDDDDKKDKS